MSGPVGTRVLLVEDDADIAAVATMALESLAGFEVLWCSSGDEALATAAGFGPDAILLDVMMPGKDGPTVLAEMRQLPALATTPVIFMTARAQAAEVARYRALGAIGVISKPFDPVLLGGEVAALLEGTRDHDG